MPYNPQDPYDPLTQLPADSLNNMLDNIEALHDGTGFATGAIPYSAMSTPVAFGAHQSVVQNIAVASFTKLLFQIEEFDNGNNFDNTTNSRFTVPTGGNGIYTFSAACALGSTADTNRMFVTIYKNGLEFKRGTRVHASTTDTIASSVTATLNLVAGDYIEVFVWQTSGGSKPTANSQHETWFNGFRVR